MSQKRIKTRVKKQKAKCKRRVKEMQNKSQKKVAAQKDQADQPTCKPKVLIREAKQEPRPAPTAVGYFLTRMWQELKLDQALEQAGIYKESGLGMGTIFCAVIMCGLVGATSLNQLALLVAQDATLTTLFGLQLLNEKQLYRGLERVSYDQYQLWMKQFIQSLQADPRTKSQKAGIVAGDTTQVAKPYAHKIPGVHVIFLHSEKRFTRGVEIINAHYADDDKDYPLFSDFYHPSPEVLAERQEKRARQKAQVNARKPREVLTYLQQSVSNGQAPEFIILSGNRLNAKFRAGIEDMNLFWLGVSDKRRVYHLDGQEKPQKAKDLLVQPIESQWLEDNDAGCRYASVGLANSTIGRVRLVMVEQFDDQSRTLYLSNESDPVSDVYSALSSLRIREKGKEESGILFQMLSLLKLSRESGIEAESATFDAWFCVPWFIKAVLEVGFVRVITKPKATFNYHYGGVSYKLPQLWSLLSENDFKTHFYKSKEYQLASLIVEMNGLGQVKLTFVRQLSRSGKKELSFILLSTDCAFADEQILRVYKLRWKIEVCYREVKQNHAFGNFHSQNANTNFGQTMLSLVAYTFVQLQQIMVPKLKEFTPGWIIDEYLGAIVNLIAYPDGQVVIELPSWLMRMGLPDWQTFAKPV